MPKKSESRKEDVYKKLSQAEFEKKVLELENKGLTSEKIGEELRKQGIHPKGYGKKIFAGGIFSITASGADL